MADFKLPNPKAKGDDRVDEFREFARALRQIDRQIGFQVSSRGWCYQLEGFGLITKAEFDRVESLINECRKNGLLPIDFTAEEEGRKFTFQVADTETVNEYLAAYISTTLRAEDIYVPDLWNDEINYSLWEGEEYYIQMLVEKIDVKTLNAPICKEFNIPIACFDSETECLTIDGWKKFTEITFKDKIATQKGDGVLEYQHPTEIVNDYYCGQMYAIKNRSTDMVITPNHKVWVKRQKNKGAPERKFELREISEVAHLQNVLFKKDLLWMRKEQKQFHLPSIKIGIGKNGAFREEPEKILDMDIWLQFLGYYISEGNVNKKKTGNYIVQLSQSRKENPEIYAKMIDCISKMGYKFYGNGQEIQVSNKQLFSYLASLGKSWEKHILREFLNLSSRQCNILLDALMEGDGHWRGNPERGIYVTTSKNLADNVQELALKAGYCASISPRKNSEGAIIRGRKINSIHQCYSVNISQKNREFRINHGKKDWNVIEYAGTIHCVTVPNHIIFVRRRGKAVWSGNTSKGWSSILQRGEYARRFKEAEENGKKCLLLYCGDHDPDGLRISDFLRKNLEDVRYITWRDETEGYNPENLEIERFGLNYEFIKANNLSWIDNLITGSGGELAKVIDGKIVQGTTKEGRPHPNFHKDYVQDYLSKYGVRKCEANAIVVRPDAGRKLCRDTIEKFLGKNASNRFAGKRAIMKQKFREIREETEVQELLEEALKKIEGGKK